ncbi:hypothetical protein BDF20DRAFT_983364 [Mycotypha africana]|uniref:uncharacterized protein n=1 Tax=Mycotypha africana TaxID=64632 RepID=UPI002301510F|nr:uncharacterized protein BDF20DRAFT_983364 [Mycotypha africana]KAI8967022.1 hypothetical protein BDF20DRAFT_983364 [Mycotypha africana]
MSATIEGYPASPVQQQHHVNSAGAFDKNDFEENTQGRRRHTTSSIDEHFFQQQRRQSEAITIMNNVQSLRAGKLPTNEQLNAVMDRFLNSKVIERNRTNLSEDGQTLLNDLQELIIAFQRALQTKNRDELFQSFVYHVHRSEAALKASSTTGNVATEVQRQGAQIKEEARMTGKEILKVIKLFVFNADFRALLSQIISIAQQTMSDTLKVSDKTTQENASSSCVNNTGAADVGSYIKEGTGDSVDTDGSAHKNLTSAGQQDQKLKNYGSSAVYGNRHSNKLIPEMHRNFVNHRFEDTEPSIGVTDDANHTLQDDKQHGAILHSSGFSSRLDHVQPLYSAKQQNSDSVAASSSNASSRRQINVFLTNVSSAQPTADPNNDIRRSMEINKNFSSDMTRKQEQLRSADSLSPQIATDMEQQASFILPSYNTGKKQLKAFMTDSTDIQPLQSVYSGMNDQSLSSFSTGFLGNTIRIAGDYRREEFYGRSAPSKGNKIVSTTVKDEQSTAGTRSDFGGEVDYNLQRNQQGDTDETQAKRVSMSDALSGAYFAQKDWKASNQQKRGSIDAYYESQDASVDQVGEATTPVVRITCDSPSLRTKETGYETANVDSLGEIANSTKPAREHCLGINDFNAFSTVPSVGNRGSSVPFNDVKNRRHSAPNEAEEKESPHLASTLSQRNKFWKVSDYANPNDRNVRKNSSIKQPDFIQQQAMNDLGAAYIGPYSNNNSSSVEAATDSLDSEDDQIPSKMLQGSSGMNTDKEEEINSNSQSKSQEEPVVNEVISKLKETMAIIQKNPEYQQAITTLISLFDVWSKRISSGKDKFERRRSSTISSSEQAEYYLNIATVEAKTIIEDWAQGTSLNPLLQQTYEVSSNIKHDMTINNLLTAASNYIKRLMKEPEYLTSDDATEDGTQLFNEFRHSGRRLTSQMNGLIQAYLNYLGRISDDVTSTEISRKFKDIHKHLWYNSDGRATFKPQLLNDMRICLLPALFEQIKYIPLPKILYSDKQYDIVIENMVLQGDTLMPNIIEIKADDYLRFSPNTKLSYANSQSMAVHLSGIQAIIEEAVFYYKRKGGFPRVSDCGVISLSTGGRGLSVSMRLVTSSADQTHTFRIDQSHCQLDKLRHQSETLQA